MKIDEQLKTALQTSVKKYGGQSAFARRCGVTKQAVSKYLKGDIAEITVNTWLKLQPLIQEFLPEGYVPEIDRQTPKKKHVIYQNIMLIEEFGDELPTREQIIERLKKKIENVPSEKTMRLLLLLLNFDETLEMVPEFARGIIRPGK